MVSEDKPECLICQACRTQIAAREELQFIFPVEGEEKRAAVFYDVYSTNVQVVEPIHYRRCGRSVVADIYCLTCGVNLGFKYMDGNQLHSFNGKAHVIKNGMVNLILEKLLWSNGQETKPAENAVEEWSRDDRITISRIYGENLYPF